MRKKVHLRPRRTLFMLFFYDSYGKVGQVCFDTKKSRRIWAESWVRDGYNPDLMQLDMSIDMQKNSAFIRYAVKTIISQGNKRLAEGVLE